MSLTLRCASLVCELKPELGGCIAGLWSDGIAVLQSTPADQLQSVRQAASYPLVPYSNRIAQALFSWQGQTYPLVKNWQPDPHSIHGVGWERPWVVVSQDAASAQLVYRHAGDTSWPFAFEATQAIALSADALSLRMDIRNLEDHAVPVGLGWHPFFAKRPGSRVVFEATGRWEAGVADPLPTHRLASSGLDAQVADLVVDHCFDGWSGVVKLTDDALAIRISSSLRHLVVYTLPSRPDIAIEPVSHVNNAMGQWPGGQQDLAALGVVTLQPGEQFSSAMRIDIQHH
ncbi:MAG: aldose epimerase [Burkholderiales bacterium PBB3]|nr:MAG: aldose epimerase [Burkholderiales bacterium PBB3]